MVLKEAYALPDPANSAPAMVFNGGIAYSGGMCGALTGAAMALGMLAESRFDDHAAAKTAARQLVAATIDAFADAFGATDCRTLTGFDMRTEAGHRAFIRHGAWRVACRRQIEFVVTRLAPLSDPESTPEWAARGAV